MENYLTLNNLGKLDAFATTFSRLEDKYMVARLKGIARPLEPLEKPMRMSCMTIMLCRRGSMDVELNMIPYHVKSNSLLVIPPRMLIKTPGNDLSRLDLYVLFVSQEFLLDVNIDLNTINIRSLIEKQTPVLSVSDDDTNKLIKFIDLLDLNAREPESTVFTTNVARSLLAGAFYQILSINFQRLSKLPDESASTPRRSTYVHDFMRLVHLNYTQHRSLSFYAEQLYITPKYLTLLVKEATGRSATQWINDFVITEAKNLLRFSGKNVQQVAYALNFSNQSAFGKYFKHLTGISPTAYQKK